GKKKRLVREARECASMVRDAAQRTTSARSDHSRCTQRVPRQSLGRLPLVRGGSEQAASATNGIELTGQATGHKKRAFRGGRRWREARRGGFGRARATERTGTATDERARRNQIAPTKTLGEWRERF